MTNPSLQLYHSTHETSEDYPTPGSALFRGGPMVRVLISSMFAEEGSEAVEPVDGFALVDTGSSCTVIADFVPERLRLEPRSRGKLAFGTNPKLSEHLRYGVLIDFPGSRIARHHVSDSPAGSLLFPSLRQPFVAVLGRDFLFGKVLVYNGHEGSFSISLPPVDDAW
jgi:hypothetical protein